MKKDYSEFAGKVAVVTGAASGIGRQCAELFGTAGAQVYACDLNGQTRQEQIFASGGRCLSMRLDVSSEQAVTAFFSSPALSKGIDILVNCAGVQRLGAAEDTTLNDWQETFAVNVTGAFLTARAAIPLMRKRGAGAIVNVSSIHARVTAGARVAYVASKTAVLGLTRALAMDHGRDGIRVNAVLPGVIDTPMLREAWERLRGGRSQQQLQSSVEQGTPLGRIGQTVDVAHAIAYLASPHAAFITGQELVVDGGVTNRLALTVQNSG